MKILANVQPLIQPLSGVGQYIYQLYNAILDFDVPCQFYYRYHVSKQLKTGGGDLADFFEKLAHPTAITRMSMNIARKAVFLSAGKALGKGVVYHEPNFVPFRVSFPTVLTIHDLSPLRLPETHRSEWVEIFKARVPAAIASCRHILVDSESTRLEVLDFFPEAEGKITLAHLGVRDHYRPMNEEETRPVLDRLGLVHGGYILAVGTLEPRKNLPRAVKAFSLLPQEIRRRYPLVIAGMKGWLNEDFDRVVHGLVEAGEAKMVGFVPDHQLNALYAGARVLVYPSIYEGFGLPPLEAMASGTPVITGNLTSLPEVVGEAGIMVDPFEIDALKQAICELIEDEALHSKFSVLGVERAKGFTWKKTAEISIDVFDKVSRNEI
jgi:alpha-1,3-rhamnosyl/mannosyltransferase